MAATVLSYFVDLASENIGSRVTKMFEGIAGVDKELSKLASTLSTIRGVLENAEARQAADPPVKRWLEKLRGAAFDIDDLLDEISTETAAAAGRPREDDDDHRDKKARAPFTFLKSQAESIYNKLNIAKRIDEIQEGFDEISAGIERYNLFRGVVRREDSAALSCVDQLGDLRGETASYVDESAVFGREEDKRKIVDFLRDDSFCNGNGPDVLSIVGLGGLGKTALARLAYNEAQGRFDLAVWVYVSGHGEDFFVRRVAGSILESVRGERYGGRPSSLDYIQHELRERLKNRKFMVVLDDVWNEKDDKWEDLKAMLTTGARGSKILVTTRSERVANIVGTVQFHSLEGLMDEDCWKIFERKAFGMGSTTRSRIYEDIGREIVKKCNGLPLAAEALGSMMRFKRYVGQWEAVRDSEIWQLTDDEKILPALRLSYNNLPPMLRSCFAYCSIIPKGFKMRKNILVLLWMAEGLIQPPGESRMDMEELAFECLDELISRSLLQSFGGSDTVIKMHNLMHDLASSIVGEDCAIIRFDTEIDRCAFENLRYSSVLQSSNRLQPKDVTSIAMRFRKAEKLRCLFHADSDNRLRPNYLFRDPNKQQLPELLEAVLDATQHLRALHLSYFEMEELPIRSGKLKHLRYLNVGATNIKQLPQCIGHLSNLQTLILEQCIHLQSLPDTIGNLYFLSYLDLQGCIKLESLPDSIGKLSSLSYLNLRMCLHLQSLPESVGNLRNLRTLILYRCYKLQSLPESLWRPYNLSYLDLSGLRFLQALPETIGSDLRNLQTLILTDTGIRSLAGSICKLDKVSYLDLSYCSHLQSLPESIDGDLHNLQTLLISNCEGLHLLPEWIGDLYSLSYLKLGHCKYLQSLPDSIGRLRNLQVLILSGCKGLHLLPDSIGCLMNLWHLDVSYCDGIHRLPQSISSLTNLVNMSLRGCGSLRELPENTKNMKGLVFLNIEGCSDLICMPEGMSCLNNLRTLPKFVLNNGSNGSVGRIGELGSLNNLEGFLQITNLREVSSAAEARDARLQEKQSLQGVSLCWDAMSPIASSPFISDEAIAAEEGFAEGVLDELEPPIHIRWLCIGGFPGRSPPSWITHTQFQHLNQVVLHSCARLETIPALGLLPCLSSLIISTLRAIRRIGPDFYGRHGAFPALSLLALTNLTSLEEWTSTGTSEGNEPFPSLHCLTLRGCPKLRALPSGFPKVTILKMDYDCELLLASIEEDGRFPDLKYVFLYGCMGRVVPPPAIQLRGSSLEVRLCIAEEEDQGEIERPEHNELSPPILPPCPRPRHGSWR